MGLEMVGIEPHRFLIPCRGFLVFFQANEYMTQAGMGISVGRQKLDRLLESQGGIQVSLLLQQTCRPPQVDLGVGRRMLANRWPRACLSGRLPLLLPQHLRHVGAGGLKVRPKPQCTLVTSDGFVASALHGSHQAQVVMGVGITGLGIDDLLEITRGLVELALPCVDDSQGVEGRGVTGPELDDALKTVHRLRDIALGLAAHAQAAPGIGVGWIDLQGLAIELLRLGEVAGLIKRPGLRGRFCDGRHLRFQISVARPPPKPARAGRPPGG